MAQQALPHHKMASRQYWILALLGYLLLTVVVTYPVVLRPATQMAGEYSGDTLEFVWSMWWWKRALLDLHQNPINLSLINYPDGQAFPLIPMMAQPFLLGLPLTAFISPVVAYNVIFLASFVLCGLTAYALCTELGGDRRAGFVGGLIWSFFPHKLGHALAGHLFFLLVFAFPLAALSWMRLLKTPSTRNTLWAALTLALAATVHPIYVAYFCLPLLLLLAGHTLWVERRAFLKRARIQPLATAALLAAAFTTPLLMPALIQAFQGKLFLAERGAVGFAFDGLAYILPPPSNPLVLHSPLAALADRVVLSEYESIASLGWVPLVLGILGARARWSESRVWVLIAVAGGVLALGPLLKFGGGLVHAPVEDGWSPIVMPYSFIGSLPFFQWSRTPGRLDVLVMLALSVLATFGFCALLRFRLMRVARGMPAVVVTSLLITTEYLVKFPFPTIPVNVPQPVEALRQAPSNLAVINLPVPDNQANLRSLYWQTIHQHPLVGGRVYRDIPGGWTMHEFVSSLLLSPEAVDIVPVPSDDRHWAVLTALGVKWVLYDAKADLSGSVDSQLTARLGPSHIRDDTASLFDIPPAQLQPDDLIWALGANWYPLQQWGAWPGRWFKDVGVIFLYSGRERVGRLAFTAVPGSTLHRLTIHVNGEEAGHFVVGDWAEYHTAPVSLSVGLNRIELIDEDGAQTYVGDARCAGGSPVSGPFPVSVPCDTTDRTARKLSLLISNVQLIPASASLPVTASGAVFGDAIQLAGFTIPAQAKPGEPIVAHLVWQAMAPGAEDFTVFVHLIGPDGSLVAQNDSWPVGGAYPTSRWITGEIVTYNVALTVPADAVPGTYAVRVGLYRWPSIERLPVSGVEGAQDNVVQLTTVTIAP